jgi:hypothetical protein
MVARGGIPRALIVPIEAASPRRTWLSQTTVGMTLTAYAESLPIRFVDRGPAH